MRPESAGHGSIDFAGKVARRYDSWYETPIGAWADEVERRLFLELARPRRGERALDVGCGTGRYIHWLLGRGVDAFGVDISPDMLAIARGRLAQTGDHWRIALADAHRLPFHDGAFDLAYAVTTLEFVSDPAACVREMGRVSRGRIFIGALNRHSAYYLAQRGSSGPLSRAHWFTPAELSSIVRSALPGWQVTVRTALLWLPSSSRWLALARIAEALTPIARPFAAFIALLATR